MGLLNEEGFGFYIIIKTMMKTCRSSIDEWSTFLNLCPINMRFVFRFLSTSRGLIGFIKVTGLICDLQVLQFFIGALWISMSPGDLFL